MNFREALNEIIDSVADVEEHGEAIEVLQDFASNRAGEDDSTWRDKYTTLEAEYKKRFKERMQTSANNSGQKKEEKEEKITVEDLDFNGKTE